MALDLVKRTRWLAILAMLAGAAATGCVADSGRGDAEAVATDDITQVSHTKVKRQSIGNCWIYATSSWLEALDRAATGQEKDTSESWLTYWHWFEQLATGGTPTKISTGGTYGTAAALLSRYGVVLEGDFIAGDVEAEMSSRQSSALHAVEMWLESGPLKDAVARRDRRAIRAELDKAWELEPAVIARIDAVFGEGVTRTLDRSPETAALAAANRIVTPKTFPVQLLDPETKQKVNVTLADALGTPAGFSRRAGKFAWNELDYPRDATARRAFWKRVQRALHDNQPVIASWKVDFNALDARAVFSMDELRRRGPGRQGGHMTVMHDYQADVPGVGRLMAGVPATPEQMSAALADGTVIQFVRVKNSWGGIRPDRWTDAAVPGYHDLDMFYLDGPIKECPEDHGTDASLCTRDVTPLWDVVLPAGY